MNATGRNHLPILLLAAALTMTACDSATTEAVTAPSSSSSTTTTAVATSQAPIPVEVEDPGSITPPTTIELPSGEWLRTNPDLGGLYVQTRDMIWDGEAFYLLTRIGFGDLIVWRSVDGIDWVEYSMIGTSGTTDGPGELVSMAGHLIAAGHRDGVATVWIDEGTTPWREVEVGEGAIRSLVNFKGMYVALGTSTLYEIAPYPPPSDRHAVIWTSWDAETWTQVAGAEVFGEDSHAAGLLEGPAGLLTIGFQRVGPLDMRPSIVAITTNGTDWTAHEPVGLNLPQADGLIGDPDGYAAFGLMSPVARSSDGIRWDPQSFNAPVLPGMGFPHRHGMASFRGHLVISGGVEFVPEGSEYYTTHPRVWIHLGRGEWAELGTGQWFDRPGMAYEVVASDDRLVVLGETEGENWGIFTFVSDEGKR